MHLIKRLLDCTLNVSRRPRDKSLCYINFLSLSFSDSIDSRCNRTKTTTNILWQRKVWNDTHKRDAAYFSFFSFPRSFSFLPPFWLIVHICLSAAHFTSRGCRRIDFQFLCLPKQKIHHGTHGIRQVQLEDSLLLFFPNNNKSVFCVFVNCMHLYDIFGLKIDDTYCV